MKFNKEETFSLLKIYIFIPYLTEWEGQVFGLGNISVSGDVMEHNL